MDSFLLRFLGVLLYGESFGRAVATAARDPATQPNVVVLLADDTGWGDLSSYGHPTQEYGHIDQMAAEGVRFTQWYTGESLCTPSRAALQTEGEQESRVLSPTSTGGLQRSELTIANILKSKGYTTGLVGKWHLGINKDTDTDGYYLPYHHGYDYAAEITFKEFLPYMIKCTFISGPEPKPEVCFVYRNTSMVQQPIDHSNLTANIAAEATSFITQQAAAKNKFYLFVGFAHMHVAMFTSPAWSNSSVNGIWGANFREMDWAVGQILASIKAASIAEETVVFFTSDHGPHIELCLEGGTTGVLRGGKAYSSWEGGMRVPGIVWWPGTIAAGRETNELASTMDIFTTVASLAGVTLPTDRIFDGKDLSGVLRSETASSPHDFMFHYCSSRLMAVRHGAYKVKYFTEQLPLENESTTHCSSGSPHGEFFQTWNCFGEGVTEQDPPLLFNIESDPAERFPLTYNVTQPNNGSGVCNVSATSSPNVYNHTGMPDAGYHSVQLPNGPDIVACQALCCNDPQCGSVTMAYPWALDDRASDCSKGSACCFFNPLHAAPTAPRPTSTLAFVARQGDEPIYTGALAKIVQQVQEAVARHNAALVPGTPQLSASNASVQPCCKSPKTPGACGCNYPNPNPVLTSL